MWLSGDGCGTDVDVVVGGFAGGASCLGFVDASFVVGGSTSMDWSCGDGFEI